MENLHGFDVQISTAFISSWKNRVLRVYGMEFNITEDLMGGLQVFPLMVEKYS